MSGSGFALFASSGRLRLPALAGATLALLLAIAALAAPSRAQARQYSDCQPYAARPCLFPFPDNRLTVADRATPTGRRVQLPAAAMPAATSGRRLSVTPFDRNDGFSPGSAILLHIPQLDTARAFARTNPVELLDLARYRARRAPIMVLDERTGKRVMIYAQLDANATTPAATNLMIQPGASWRDGHTYIVVLRRLRSSAGRLIPAPGWFAKLRDRRALPRAERAQSARYRRIFAVLRRDHVARNRTLYAAWDFTVASRHSLTHQLVHIRNAAFRTLGDNDLRSGKLVGRAPSFKVTGASTESVDAAGVTGDVKVVTGSYRVPCYLVQCGPTAATGFHYSSHRFGAAPTQHGTTTALFECVIPSSASPTKRSRIVLYGHGLFGSMAEVTGGSVTSLAVRENMTLCATNWWGLAAPDEAPTDVGVILNLNRFPVFTGRLQQGVLNTLFLGRLLRSPRGLASDPAFRSGGRSVLNTSELYYDGNSQGGIFGGLTTAVSPDIRRAVLGVTGTDYANVLIQRSTDFTALGAVLRSVYAPANDRSAYTAVLDLLDQQWDSADPVAYVDNLSGGGLGTPGHRVLMQIAYGDHQVSMYAGAAEAREIGADAYLPRRTGLEPDRAVNRNLLYGLKAAPLNGRYTGSVVEVWDDGPGLVASPPVGNLPPTAGHDPHGDPRVTPAAQVQIGAFLSPHGTFVNVCHGAPCQTSNYAR